MEDERAARRAACALGRYDGIVHEWMVDAMRVLGLAWPFSRAVHGCVIRVSSA